MGEPSWPVPTCVARRVRSGWPGRATVTSVTSPPGSRQAPPSAPGRSIEHWLFLSHGGDSLHELTRPLRELAQGGHRIRIGFVRGPLPDSLPGSAQCHGIRPPGTGRRYRAARAAVDRTRSVRLLAALSRRRDPWLSRQAASADHVLYVDRPALSFRDPMEALAPHAHQWGPEQVQGVLAEEAAWRRIDQRLRSLADGPEGGDLSLRGIRREVSDAAALETYLGPWYDIRDHTANLGRRMARAGRLGEIRRLLAVAEQMRVLLADDAEPSAVRAIREHLRLTVEEGPTEHFASVVAELLAAADRSLENDDVDGAVDLICLALGLLFHPALHAAVEHSDLIDDPEAYLAVLRDCRVVSLLCQARGISGSDGSDRVDDHTEQVDLAALPGVYPWHGRSLLETLGADPRARLTVVQPAGKTFRGIGIDAGVVRFRLLEALGREPEDSTLEITAEQSKAVTTADVVLADWADKGALWASTRVAPRARFVVRVHGIDTLSPAIHLLDWSVVTDLICVSAHLRDMVLRLLGARVAHVQTHVIGNIVPACDLALHPLFPDAPRTLGMVGWNKPVKDPLMALEMLSRLLAREEGWRLRLIGDGFKRPPPGHPDQYAREVRRRLQEPDLASQIDVVGFSDNVPEELRHAGFILSTSRRESFHKGAVEGVASGSYPVIRQWPAYRQYAGASKIFPEHTVFETVDEAVEQIWALRDEADRRAAAELVRQQMAGLVGEDLTRDRLRQIILDPTVPATSRQGVIPGRAGLNG